MNEIRDLGSKADCLSAWLLEVRGVDARAGVHEGLDLVEGGSGRIRAINEAAFGVTGERKARVRSREFSWGAKRERAKEGTEPTVGLEGRKEFPEGAPTGFEDRGGVNHLIDNSRGLEIGDVDSRPGAW